MKTNLEFRSATLLEPAREDEVRGQTIARFLADHLPDHGFSVEDVAVEDWGWRVSIVNPAFPLWIGCGHYQEWPDGLLCFLEPDQPFLRRWFRKIPTGAAVTRLGHALEAIVRNSGQASDIRWWGEEENRRG